MEFQFDLQKSASNHSKHGIDFVEAQQMWEDPDRLEIPARTEDEPRWLLIARIDEEVWSAVFTHRGDSVRIISVRRARDVEVKLYES